MRNRSRTAARPSRLVLKVTFLLSALVGVLGLMSYFQSYDFKDQVKGQMAVLLGTATEEKAWRWCPPGLTEIQIFPSQKVITAPQHLNALCSVNFTPSSSEEIAQAQFKPVLKTSGTGAEIQVEEGSVPDLFRISGFAFHSKSFRKVINNLK